MNPKAVVKELLRAAGVYYAKRQYMPCGIDWLWDVQRLARHVSVRTVFDVGANVGQTSKAVSSRFAKAVIHAFEPVSDTYVILCRNVRHLANVTCHRLALSDRIGRAQVTICKNSQLNRLLQTDDVDESPSAPESEVVDTETIDHYCALHQIETIDILKIDAEGTDLRVLHGASAMLREGRVTFVFVEVGFANDDRTHVHFPLIYEYLTQAGLKLYSFYDYYHDAERLEVVFANVLFLSPAGIERMR